MYFVIRDIFLAEWITLPVSDSCQSEDSLPRMKLSGHSAPPSGFGHSFCKTVRYCGNIRHQKHDLTSTHCQREKFWVRGTGKDVTIRTGCCGAGSSSVQPWHSSARWPREGKGCGMKWPQTASSSAGLLLACSSVMIFITILVTVNKTL